MQICEKAKSETKRGQHRYGDARKSRASRVKRLPLTCTSAEPKTLNAAPAATALCASRPPSSGLKSGRTYKDGTWDGILLAEPVAEPGPRPLFSAHDGARPGCPPPLSTSQSISPRARSRLELAHTHFHHLNPPAGSLEIANAISIHHAPATLSRDRCAVRASATRRAHHSARPHTHHT